MTMLILYQTRVMLDKFLHFPPVNMYTEIDGTLVCCFNNKWQYAANKFLWEPSLNTLSLTANNVGLLALTLLVLPTM